MQIAVVSPYGLDRQGGVQNHARQLVAKLNELGDQAWLVGPGHNTWTQTERQIGRDFGVPANGSIAPVSLNPKISKRLHAELLGADVVHIHEPWIPFVGWAAMAFDAPAVLTFHADPSKRIRWLYRRNAHRLRHYVHGAAAITAVSPVAAAAIAPFVREPSLIPNAVPPNPYVGADDRDLHQVVFVGRDDPRKGLDVLLEAWPAVRRSVPDARLEVISSRQAPEGDGVRFHTGVGDDMKLRMLAAAGVYCAPNLGGESFGITVAEGMAAGCAIVASRLAAFEYLLEGSGTFVPIGDSRALAARLIDHLIDEALIEERAASSSKRVARFGWDVVGLEYQELFRSIEA